MEAVYPEDEESIAAREGTAAHHYLSETLSGREPAAGTPAPNGVIIDREMVEAAADIIRDILDTLKTATSGSLLAIEKRVFAVASIHAQNWGTPDCYILDRVKRKLHLWDYKYGHRYVDAFRNWQLVNYLIAILESEKVPPSDWHLWNCTATIGQPRNYHPDGPMREWFLPGAELITLTEELRVAAHAAVAPNAPLRTGDHCRDCNARHACPALERVSMSLVDLSMTAQPINLPPPALGLELRLIREAMKRLGARATGLEEQALAQFRAGIDIPHWRAEYSKGREKWRDDAPVPELVALGAMYDVDILKPPTPITPTQARKAGVDTEVIKAYSTTPRGAMALVPFDQSDIARRFHS